MPSIQPISVKGSAPKRIWLPPFQNATTKGENSNAKLASPAGKSPTIGRPPTRGSKIGQCAATRTRQLRACLLSGPRLATMRRARPAGVPARNRTASAQQPRAEAVPLATLVFQNWPFPPKQKPGAGPGLIRPRKTPARGCNERGRQLRRPRCDYQIASRAL
jgi:hypothetical protein